MRNFLGSIFDVRCYAFGVFLLMKRKRIIVMGFMGSMPIAGVVWQHVHYVSGLRRLGHDVFYIEDSARLPYNPETFEVTDEFEYAAQVLTRLAGEFDFKSRWAYCARYLPDTPTAGMSLKKIRQLYRDADAILNVCGAQEFNDDLLVSDRILYIESDPGVEQIKIDKGVKSTVEYLRRHHALFTFGENIGTKEFHVPIHGSKGEFTVAKDQYVRLNTGWFSDRSACYLAAGRPVITQETGFTKNYGSKEGLLSFQTVDEIADAAKKINADYAKHSRAARALACEVFEAEKVLASILDRADI